MPMTLAEVSIKHPVMATMISLFFLLVGIVSYVNLPVQLSPAISSPVITITTEMPGGNASIINQSVTKLIENQINTIGGISQIQSSSIPGKSQIEVSFVVGTNLDSAFNQVDNRINHIRSQLPKDARPPLITLDKSNAAPIILLSLHGSASLLDMDEYARNNIQKKLERIEGVGQVKIVGISDEAINIHLNLKALAAHDITPSEVEQAFNNNHIELPGGEIASGEKTYSLNLDLERHSINDLKRLVISYRNNAPITLGQIATINFGLSQNYSAANFAGQPSVGISIIKKSDSNTLDIADKVISAMDNLRTKLPPNMQLSAVYNQATYIDGVITELEQDIWISVLTAIIVILLFLKSLRSSLIIVCSIPISLLGSIAVLYAFGFTLNTITLLALVILVGIVVDDSIVVLENTFRYISKGDMDRKAAAIKGANRVAFAVLASSLTLICIFLPVAFMGGTLAKILTSLGVVISGGVIISFIISLTLTPVMCRNLLRARTAPYRGLYLYLENAFNWLDKKYTRLITSALKHRLITIIALLIFIGISIPAFFFISVSLTPPSGNAGYFNITIQPPQGLGKKYTTTKIKEVENTLKNIPEIKHYFSSLGPGRDGSISVQLKKDAIKQQDSLMDSIRKNLQTLAGAEFFVVEPTNKNNFTFDIRGPNFNHVLEQALKLSRSLNKHSNELGPVYIHFTPNQPQFDVIMDHILANSVGITSKQVAETLSIVSGQGVRIGYFSREQGGNRYKVLLRTEPDGFNSAMDLSKIYLRTKDNKKIPLTTIVQLEKSLAPAKITRTDLEYSIGFSASPTISNSKAIQLVHNLADPIIQHGYSISLSGATLSAEKSDNRAFEMLMLMLILIYMVLASQFNSFIQPLIVMVAQPLAMIGGVLILWFSQQPLSMYGIIGMLLLIGLVSKNSILLIDLMNKLRKEGMSIHEAILTACPTRMKPVLMTALAIIFAMLSAAVSTGPGASSYHPLAWVIIGGMIISTCLTLIIVPVLYSLLFSNTKLGKDLT
jgi:HAE1 family hydrophobic/amphiphilic exporter-1